MTRLLLESSQNNPAPPSHFTRLQRSKVVVRSKLVNRILELLLLEVVVRSKLINRVLELKLNHLNTGHLISVYVHIICIDV